MNKTFKLKIPIVAKYCTLVLCFETRQLPCWCCENVGGKLCAPLDWNVIYLDVLSGMLWSPLFTPEFLGQRMCSCCGQEKRNPLNCFPRWPHSVLVKAQRLVRTHIALAVCLEKASSVQGSFVLRLRMYIRCPWVVFACSWCSVSVCARWMKEHEVGTE